MFILFQIKADRYFILVLRAIYRDEFGNISIAKDQNSQKKYNLKYLLYYEMLETIEAAIDREKQWRKGT